MNSPDQQLHAKRMMSVVGTWIDITPHERAEDIAELTKRFGASVTDPILERVSAFDVTDDTEAIHVMVPMFSRAMWDALNLAARADIEDMSSDQIVGLSDADVMHRWSYVAMTLATVPTLNPSSQTIVDRYQQITGGGDAMLEAFVQTLAMVTDRSQMSDLHRAITERVDELTKDIA